MAQPFARPAAGGSVSNNLFFRSLVFMAREVIFDIVSFPVAWYTVGLARALRYLRDELASWVDRLALTILARHLFKPMFGDYTRTGRIISFFMRILVFAFRLCVFALWVAVLAVLLALYLVLPVAATYLAVANFFGRGG